MQWNLTVKAIDMDIKSKGNKAVIMKKEGRKEPGYDLFETHLS